MISAWKYKKACQWTKIVVWLRYVILAHLADLAQFYFSLIFCAIHTYNCSWFDLANKKNCSDWKQKLGEEGPMLRTFFLTATAAITGTFETQPCFSETTIGSSTSGESLNDIFANLLLNLFPKNIIQSCFSRVKLLI